MSNLIEQELENLRFLMSKLFKGAVFSSFELKFLNEQEFEKFIISSKKFVKNFVNK